MRGDANSQQALEGIQNEISQEIITRERFVEAISASCMTLTQIAET